MKTPQNSEIIASHNSSKSNEYTGSSTGSTLVRPDLRQGDSISVTSSTQSKDNLSVSYKSSKLNEKDIISKVISMPAFTSMFLVGKHKAEISIMSKPIVLVIGGPGSGKGTICERIRTKYTFSHLSTGDLLRDEVESGSERGKILQEIMKEGKLVSNEQVLDLLQIAMKNVLLQTKGYLIDGYPREVGQAKDFENKIAPATLIFYFHCPDNVMTQRLLKRGQNRVDDNIETIQKRLKTFHSNTEPILNYFKERIIHVNADQDIEIVFNTVDQHIRKVVG